MSSMINHSNGPPGPNTGKRNLSARERHALNRKERRQKAAAALLVASVVAMPVPQEEDQQTQPASPVILVERLPTLAPVPQPAVRKEAPCDARQDARDWALLLEESSAQDLLDALRRCTPQIKSARVCTLADHLEGALTARLREVEDVVRAARLRALDHQDRLYGLGRYKKRPHINDQSSPHQRARRA